MTPERWQSIERLYYAALERDTDEQAAFLAEACAGDEALRGEVESLLHCDAGAEQFMESPALEVAAQLCAEDQVQSTIERQIGPYQILSLLGAGGMGEVHLALDTRLGRKVAVKLLLTEFATDAERLRRFEQEARAVSALNHPNIITVHEIGEIEGRRFIVTEYVKGEPLRRRMSSASHRRIRMSEALEIASQVAAALQAAHEAGITHRDIKPENVMLRADGLVKVLDFGLAKLSGARTGHKPEAENLNTRSGIVMGTASYMSPEQARGEKVDHRTDIFSLGVMLYEMLAGRRPFEGATANDVIAAMLTSEPVSLAEVVPEVPATLRRIVQRCLEKRPGQRFQSAGDLGFALEEVSTSSSAESQLGTKESTPAVTEHVGSWFVRKRERVAWLATVAALLLGMLGFAWAYLTSQSMTYDARVTKSSILPPEGSSFGQIAISPDGRHLAFTAARGGNLKLWVRAFDSSEARELPGTQGAIFPFWSPDSRFVGFFAEGQLKKIEVTGGLVHTLCEAPQPTGGAWSRASVILFGRRSARGLLRISATGGEVIQVTTLDVSRQELTHRYPTFLPDGRHFLYSIQSWQKETRGVYLGSLDDGTLKRQLLDNLTPVKYMAAVPGATAGAGWLVFGRDGALLARPFETSRLEFSGEPSSISDKVGNDLVFTSNFAFSVSDNGVLVLDPGLERQRHQYRWMDRRGQPINSMTMEAGSSCPWLSPDEKRFIADRIDSLTGASHLWLCDLSGSKPERFTFDQASDLSPLWAPDGSRIVWTSNRDGATNLYQKAASGAGEETLLWKSEYLKATTDWSRDGRFIIYRQTGPKTKEDIWALPVTGNGVKEPIPLIRTEYSETAGTLSPDGRWLAYTSNETGQYEIYVQRFPDGGGKRQVSNGGGIGPRWRRDGRELFYYARNGEGGKLMAARVKSGESLEMGAVASLFEFIGGTQIVGSAPYDVTGDGQRFLINELVETKPNAPLTVVFNWTASLSR